MKKIAFLLMAFVCILTPSVARADDGGILDMLFHWDPKFIGVGTEFHVVCLNESGERVKGCEEWFRGFKHLFHPTMNIHAFDFNEIKHELNFRVSYLRSYGERVSSPAPTDPKQSDTRGINAWKLIGFYSYHVNRHVELGAGAGAIPIYGEDVPLFWRGIATPFSLVWAPGGTGPWGILTLRAEESYITNTITGDNLGHPLSAFANDGEWNFSATVGFDLRRVGTKR